MATARKQTLQAKRPARPRKSARVSSERGSRRELIAEAVIELLAREGGRGLTHGNIDAWLRLPKGSTSFYFRRRAELFEAGLSMLVAEDLARLNKVLDPLFAKHGEMIPIREIAECHYVLWQQQTKLKMRARTMARFEFFLHAARDRPFAKFHERARQGIFELGASMFARMGAKNPRYAATEYGYLFRGDTLAYFFTPPSVGRHRITTDYYEQCLREIVEKTDQLPADATLGRANAPL